MRAKRVRLAVVLGLAWGAEAVAQAPHAIPPLARPLHERAADAETIAIGRVTHVERGRIAIARDAALRGTLPPEFELKRSPLRPPAVEPGDRALLFLRGARSPYVLAGEPTEIVPIASDADARALAAALPALLAAGEDAAALRATYAQWAGSASPLLRALGHAGLEALPAPAPERGEARRHIRASTGGARARARSARRGSRTDRACSRRAATR
jgi:hypothetical protein